MEIYKILTAQEWNDLTDRRETDGAPIDIADGFIHFSTAAQVRETAARHFAGQNDLVLAAFEADALGPALKWEVSRGGDRFPHLYAPLRLADVAWHADLPLEDGVHVFPNGIA
jgi:uncharacterized protein (DUF952 family)